MIVLDASIALAYIFPDEKTSAVRAAINSLNTSAAWVPSFWRIEVANGLEMAVRRGRISALYRDTMLADFQARPIRIDQQTNQYAWTEIKRLAEHHRLTLYDAAYLELAIRLDLPLATLDRALRSAAEAERILLLGL